MIDDFGGAFGTVEKDDIAVGDGIAEPTRHGHHRGDAATTGNQQEFVAGMLPTGKFTEGATNFDRIADSKVVMEPVRY